MYRRFTGRSAAGGTELGGYLILGEGAHSIALIADGDGGYAMPGAPAGEAVAPAVRIGNCIWVHVDGRAYELRWQHAVDHHAAQAGGNDASVARAPMPGVVVRLMAAEGQDVSSGDAMMIIESMKLETAIRAPRAGTVATVHVALGQTFERDAPLVTLKERADAAD